MALARSTVHRASAPVNDDCFPTSCSGAVPVQDRWHTPEVTTDLRFEPAANDVLGQALYGGAVLSMEFRHTPASLSSVSSLVVELRHLLVSDGHQIRRTGTLHRQVARHPGAYGSGDLVSQLAVVPPR
jgi:hypothetical protein